MSTSEQEKIEPLDDENAKIARFMAAFDAEEIVEEPIDVMTVNTQTDDDTIIQPPF